MQNCRFIKTILMLLVIIGHACAFWSGNWFTENPLIKSTGLDMIYRWVSSFHVYAFALVSGYIFTYKVTSGAYSMLIPFLRNKMKRLIVPYIFVTLIWVAPISSSFFKWDLSYIIKKYLLAVDPSQLWFLWMLFWVFLFAWLMRKTLLEKPILGWAITIAFYGIGMIGKLMLPNVFCFWTACQYLLFFFLGMRLRIRDEIEKVKLFKQTPWFVWVVADILVFCATIALKERGGTIWSLLHVLMNLLLNVIGAIMAWTCLQTLAKAIPWKNNIILNKLSFYSMPIYLFHQQIMYFTITWMNGKVSPWINATVNFISALVCSYLISKILAKWKITRTYIGVT